MDEGGDVAVDSGLSICSRDEFEPAKIRSSTPESSFAAVTFHIPSSCVNPSGTMTTQGSRRTHSRTQVRPVWDSGFWGDIIGETGKIRNQIAAQSTEGVG